MGQKLNPPSLKLRRTSKKKVTLENLAGKFDVLAVKVDNLAGTVDVLAKKMDQGFAAVDKKFEAVDQRFDSLAFAVKNGFDEQGQRFDSLENRVAKVEGSLDNFWTHTNKLSGDVNKLKISQKETKDLFDGVYCVDVKDLKKRVAIVESKI